MIVIDYQNRAPVYLQIVNQFERLISLGILKASEQIPSIRDLATSLGINPNTVKKSYEELEARGAIVTLSTKGTYVADNTKAITSKMINDKIAKIKEEIKELEKLGITKEEVIKKI